MTVTLQRRVIHGPGWHLTAVMDPNDPDSIQLYDIYIDEHWVGSRRTEKQCLEVVRQAGKATR